MKPFSILVVEQHPVQQQYLLQQLSALGAFNVNVAKDGPETKDYLKKRSVDLVLTNLLMPGMDVIQLIQHLAQLAYRPALAIVNAVSHQMFKAVKLVAKEVGVELFGLVGNTATPATLQNLLVRVGRNSTPIMPTKGNPSPNIDHARLRDGFNNSNIQTWFQPKMALSDSRIAGAEALVRWVTPDGTLLPGQFLPAIKRFRMEEHVLWLTLKQAIQAQENWRLQGYNLPVSINLPTHLLDCLDLADRLGSFVTDQGGAPEMICFELMECSTAQTPSNYYAGACRLRLKGFGLSQDDFGQGYSSLINLMSTPFTELKIDRALVQGCHENQGAGHALASIISLGLKLGVTVVAEGVESLHELAYLRGINCTQVQGFVVSPAVSAVEFQALLDQEGSATFF